MVPIMSLWLPILLSTVIAFVASSIIHMVLPYHRTDFKKLPAEDEVIAALRKFDIPPGDYLMPCAGGPGDMKNPEFLDKMKKGPVSVMTIIRAARQPWGGTWLSGSSTVWQSRSSPPTSLVEPCLPEPSIWQFSALPEQRLSLVTRWRCGRTPSGTGVPGARR